MYQTAAVLQAVNAHTVIVLALCGVSLVGNARSAVPNAFGAVQA